MSQRESQLPPIAAKWIAISVLPHRNLMEGDLQRRGLGMLSVKDLKAVGDAIHRKYRHFRVQSSAKKGQRIEILRNFFYTDPPTCIRVNESIMAELQREFRKRPAHQISTTSHNSNPLHQQQQPQQYIHRMNVNHDSQMLLQNLAFLRPNQQGYPLPPRPLESLPWGDQTGNNRYFQPAATSTTQQSFVASTSSVPPAPVPAVQEQASTSHTNNLQEKGLTQEQARMVNDLQQVGFPRQEIITAMRQSGHDTFMEVMCWIIQQREEREDARQMDAARLASEAEKEKEDAKRTATFRYANMEELKAKFSSSWILDNLSTGWLLSSIQNDKNKTSWIRLLDLEAKALKWYGNKLPSYYFLELCERGEAKNESEVGKWLTYECKSLEDGLYKLENQQGGAPKIFIAAQDKHPGDDNDDEILCIGRIQKEDSEARSRKKIQTEETTNDECFD